MSFYWQQIGRIASPDKASILRFKSTSQFGGNISFYSYFGSNSYKDFGFSYDPNTGSFNSITDYTQTITNGVSAFPVRNGSGSLAYRTQSPFGVFVRYLGTTYTLYTPSAGRSIAGLDANPELYIAYSYSSSGGSGAFINYGSFYLVGGVSPALGGFIDTALLGEVSISRNGLYVAVYGAPSGGSIRNTIKVYTPTGGSIPLYSGFTSIQVGGNITIPGTASIEHVKINNTGTRLVVSTASNPVVIYTYELVSSSWVLRDEISLSGAASARGISISSAWNLMSFRGNDFANSYYWNDISKTWYLQDVTNIPYPTGFPSYFGQTIDISEDGQFMAVDMWPTTNSTAIEIYKRVGDIPTYEIPLYKGAYAQSVYYGNSIPNSIYYGSKRLFAK